MSSARVQVTGAAIACATWLVFGCAGEPNTAKSAQQASGAEQPVTEVIASPTPDLAHHMRQSFWDAVTARDALIKGDLAAAQQAADAFAKHDYSQLFPADWKHWVGQMQQHASELSMAPNLAAASAELGRLALVCGDCHDLHALGPEHPRAQPLPWKDPPETLDSRMHRHQIGIALMWDGLVLPSERAWRNGTITITRAPLAPPEVAQEPVGDTLQAAIDDVRSLAKQARLAETYEDRGRIFGELIARCAGCHALTRPARNSGF